MIRSKYKCYVLAAWAIAGLFVPALFVLLLAYLVMRFCYRAFILRSYADSSRLPNSPIPEEPIPEINLGLLLFRSRVVDREVYLLCGTVLLGIKHNLDRVISTFGFGKPWELFNYLKPSDIINVADLPQEDLPFFITLVVLALPFIAIGVVLTVKRLRDCGWPQWLAVIFFAPYLNFILFALLSIIPTAEEENETNAERSFLDRLIPVSEFGSAVFATVVTSLIGLIITYLSVAVLRNYGWSLFVGWPFALGFIGVLLYSYHQRRTWVQCFSLVTLIIVINGFLLIAAMIEGIICLLMVAPIAWVLAVLGGFVAYSILKDREYTKNISTSLYSVALILPLLSVYEAAIMSVAEVEPVTTTIEVDAPAMAVWKNVVQFSDLPPPRDWVLKLGFAYPLRARIEGEGVGAVRYCEFTTGSFVEPIEVWDPPKLLKFSVRSQPPIMKEYNPLTEIVPAHIDNYLQSRGGQFLLTPLSSNRTRIEATTWYSHQIWPESYWRLWSDQILHRIHLRVLQHIKNLSEAPPTVIVK